MIILCFVCLALPEDASGVLDSVLNNVPQAGKRRGRQGGGRGANRALLARKSSTLGFNNMQPNSSAIAVA